jgi:hypothetical protein
MLYNLSKGEVDGLKNHMKVLLARRRDQVPWPLDRRETHLLWWPSEAHALFETLEQSGWKHLFPVVSHMSLTLPFNLTVGGHNTLELITNGPRKLFSFSSTRKGISGAKNGVFIKELLPQGSVANRFLEWYNKAVIIHAWDNIIMSAFGMMVGDAKSWRHLQMNCPEIIRALAVFTNEDKISRLGKSDIAHTLAYLAKCDVVPFTHRRLANEERDFISKYSACIDMILQEVAPPNSTQAFIRPPISSDAVLTSIWFAKPS